MVGVYEGNVNLVKVLESVGYSPVSVKGQKTKLVKSALGLEAEEAKNTFMFTQGEVIQVLGIVMKSKSDKATAAAEIFDKISKDKFEPQWLEAYAEADKTTAVKSKSNAPKKGKLEDYKEFAIAMGMREQFVKFMTEKYGEGTIVAEWE